MERCLLLLLAGCASQAHANFVGKEQPAIADAADVDVADRSELPDGYSVIGVVTASCDTYNGATGLFEANCTEEAMLQSEKQKAAEVGGAALAEPRCERKMVEKSMTRVQNGTITPSAAGAQLNEHIRLSCQASVARPADGVRRRRVGRPAAGHRVRIGEVDVAIAAKPASGTPARPPRPARDVGEIDRVPDGYPRLGQVRSECLADCGSSTARRGLMVAAAGLGAVAVAEASCEPVGDRWRCHAVAVGDRPAVAGPSATGSPAEPSAGAHSAERAGAK